MPLTMMSGRFSPHGELRAAVANWNPSCSESTRSSTTAENGWPDAAACAHISCASRAEPVERAGRAALLPHPLAWASGAGGARGQAHLGRDGGEQPRGALLVLDDEDRQRH